MKELVGSMGPFLGWAVGEGIIAAQSAERSSEANLYAEFVREAMEKRGYTTRQTMGSAASTERLEVIDRGITMGSNAATRDLE